MTSYKTRAFEAALVKKGFRVDETDHHQYWFYLDGKKTLIRTKTSHGEKEFDDFLLGKRREQMHISKRQLLDFIDCLFTAEEYRQTLLDNGIVKEKP